MSSRAFVVNLLVQRVGFSFSEADLSPGLRRKVGELADLRQGVELRQNLTHQDQAEIARLKSRLSTNTIYLAILIVVGVVLVVFIVGVVFFVVAYLMYRERQKIEAQIRQANTHIENLTNEINSINATLYPKLASVAPEIKSELSEARMMGQPPAPRAQTLQTSEVPPPPQTFSPPSPVRIPPANSPPIPPPAQVGTTVQVVRETVREVVMIQCPYCRALMPQTSLKCPHCGAVREG